MKKDTLLLKLNSEENFNYLEKSGYENIHKISFENMRVKVIVVDMCEKKILPISVTCLAAMKIKPISFEEFREIDEANNSCEDLGC